LWVRAPPNPNIGFVSEAAKIQLSKQLTDPSISCLHRRPNQPKKAFSVAILRYIEIH
jgi:hypothetical protein